MIKMHCVYARNPRMSFDMSLPDVPNAFEMCIDRVRNHASGVYDASRVEVEGYTDEIHVYLRRRNSTRRDFVASYQAE